MPIKKVSLKRASKHSQSEKGFGPACVIYILEMFTKNGFTQNVSR